MPKDETNLIQRIKAIYHSVSPEDQMYLKQILTELANYGTSKTYNDLWLADYKEIPVDKTTFLTSSEYLGSTNNNGKSIYPAWWDVLKELEATGNQYHEIVLTGATRTGKTSTAVSDAAYQLYKVMCLRDPQAYFGLKSTTTIAFFFFNITQTLAKGVAFKEFNTTISSSPWFMKHGHMTDSETNPVYIPEGGQIEIMYGSDSSHGLGRAAYAVIFDECNFAKAGVKDIEKTKEAMKQKYDTLVARVTGTFVKHGEIFGRIYVISSKNSDSDFMEEYVAKQKAANNPHMYVFDKPQWEVWPKSKYSSDKTFKIALGGKSVKSFVLSDDQDNPETLEDLRAQGYTFLDVPEDNKVRFLSDFDVALRDIAGVAVTGALNYISQDVLDRCITNTRKNPFYSDIISVGTKDNLTIEEFFHLTAIDSRTKHLPHYIHLDLSLNTDRSGMSMVCTDGKKDIMLDEGKSISQPHIHHDFSVAIEAPRGDKIPYAKITAFICWLRKQGFNIAGISRDQFQSEYMAQLLEAQGFTVDKLSLDRTPDGYTATRSILLEERIDMLHCQLLEDELTHLQRDANTGKIDHPAFGSKDIADSFAGAIWNATLKNPGVPIQAKKIANAIASVNGNRSRMVGKPISGYTKPKSPIGNVKPSDLPPMFSGQYKKY